MKIKKVHNVLSIPEQWDNLTDCYYKQKQLLLHLQNWNRCEQRYYLGYKQNKLVAGAVVYSLDLNLFTFSKYKFPVTMQIVGVPCSVSCSGLIGNSENTFELLELICSLENGFCLVLNLENTTGIPKHIIVGKTLPSIIFKKKISNWDDYLNKIRYEYRHRLKLIEKKSQTLIFKRTSCLNFNEEMYSQYLQVFNKSEAKLEKLNLNFFKFLPDEFCLTTISLKETLVGWFITLYVNNKLYYFLGGVDYTRNKECAIYLKALTEIIKLGIRLNSELIDLGQTAEEPKIRFGGEYHQLYLAAYHKNLSIRFLLRSAIQLLEYKKKIPTHNVFKEEA